METLILQITFYTSGSLSKKICFDFTRYSKD